MKKKFVSILLAMAMCLSLLPTMAWAKSYRTYYVDDTKGSDSERGELKLEEYGDHDHPFKTIAKALEEAGVGDIIVLLSDIECGRLETGDKSLTIKPEDKNVTLTLTGPMMLGKKDGEETFTLSGGDKGETLTIKPELTEDVNDFRPIAIRQGNTLNLEDGVILTGSRFNGTGGGMINVATNATLNMEGGTISDCQITSIDYDATNSQLGRGGAIYVAKGGTFNMTGGAIENCSASVAGGAVYVVGNMEMSGGKITGCSVSGLTDSDKVKAKGGAVYLYGESSFTMTGGEISGNALGNVADMRGAGVYAASGANVTLGGTAKITDNTVGKNNYSNLFLYDGVTVTLSTDTAPAEGMKVGVTMATAGAFTTTTSATQDHVKYFFSDDLNYHVVHESNALKLVSGSNWSLLKAALSAETPTSVAGVFRVNNTSPLDITLLSDITAGIGDTTLTVPTNKTVTLRLEDHTINRNLSETVENGGVITVSSGATLGVLGTGTITGGNTTGDGGGICNNGTLTFYGGTITGNKAANGGGIYNNGGTVTLGLYALTTLSNNTATIDGGGIHSNGGTLNLFSATIDGNTAAGKGGGIYTTNYVDFRSTTTIKNCQAKFGGAAYVTANGRFGTNGGKIQDCSAIGDDACGGGVYVEHGGTATFGNSASVSGCTAAKDGGGIYSKGAIGLETATINSNTATGGNGGGIYLAGGNNDADKGSIFLGKDAKVTENTKNKAANNLYLCDNLLLAKFGTGEDVQAPTSKMSIGVTTETAPTSGNPVKLTENDTSTGTYKTYLVADDSTKYEIVVTNNHLVLQVKAVPKPAHSSGGGSSVAVPVEGSKDTVKVNATVSGSNATIKNVTSEEITKAGTGAEVTIDLSGLSKSVTGVTIPKTTLENVASSEAAGLEVKLPNGTTAVFDKTTVAAIAEQAEGSNIQLVVDKDSNAEKSLTNAQKEAIKELYNPIVLDAYFVSNGKRISDFKGGKAELTAEYPTMKPIRVWYVADNGTKELVPSSFNGKTATFTVTHFSHYVIEQLDGSSYASCPQDAACPIAKFTDASTTAWYHDGVHYCVDSGMMNGIGNDMFAPGATLTRGMVVTMLARLSGVDTTTNAVWFVPGTEWAVKSGISDGTNMTADITREQLATMLYRYAQLKNIDTNKFTENTSTLSCTDVFTISDWAGAGMHFCIAAGVVNGDNGMLYPTHTATRVEAAAMFQRFCEKVIAK